MRDFVVELRQQLVPEVKNLTAAGDPQRVAAASCCGRTASIAANRMRYAGRRVDAPAGRAAAWSAAAARALAVPDRPGRRRAVRGGLRPLLRDLPRRLLRLRAGPRLSRPEEGEEERRPAAQRRLPQHDGLLPRRRPAVRADPRRRRAARARPPVAGVRLHHRRPDAAVHELHLVRARPTRASCATPSSTSPAPRTRTPTSEAKIKQLAEVYLAKARRIGASDGALGGDRGLLPDHLGRASAGSSRRAAAAEPRHLEALQAFAERAYRRPLSAAERDDVAAFYRSLREKDGLGHEDAVRDTRRQRADVAALLLPRRPARRRAPASGRCRITPWPAA